MARILIYAQEKLAEALAIVLSMHGHNPICSDRPREALRQIITFRPELVLAEYLEIEGEWLCREIRKIKQLEDTQVIMMSALGASLTEEKFRDRVLAFGANNYLLKPFPCREIGDLVDYWLSAKKMSPYMRALIKESQSHIRKYQKNMTFQEKVLQDQFDLAKGSLSDDQLALILAKMRTKK